MELQSFKKGTVINQEGSASDGMYIVKKGKVEVYKTINAERVQLSIISSNDFFGEMSLFLNAPRTASVMALEDTEVIFLKKEDLFEQIKKEPEFALMMTTRLAKRLKEAHSVIAKLEGEKKAFELLHR